jgi:hypothetical protein
VSIPNDSWRVIRAICVRAEFWEWTIRSFTGQPLDKAGQLIRFAAREMGHEMLGSDDLEAVIEALPWDVEELWRIADRVDFRGRSICDASARDYERRSLCAAIGVAGDRLRDLVDVLDLKLSPPEQAEPPHPHPTQQS